MDTATIRAGSIALTLETVPTTKTQATAARGPIVHPTVNRGVQIATTTMAMATIREALTVLIRAEGKINNCEGVQSANVSNLSTIAKLYYSFRIILQPPNWRHRHDGGSIRIMADTIAIEGNGQLNIHIGQKYQDSGLLDLRETHEIVHLIR
jgi:hypothetical protein